MSANLLVVGLLVSGGVGFTLGGKPSLFAGKHGNGHPNRAQLAMDLLYPLAVAFFAGFVFSTLVPHALTHSRGSILTFAAGIALMAVLSKLVFKQDPCCEGGHNHGGFGAMSMMAMSVCSLNDGILIGLLNPDWFSGLNLGMLVHKITSSFAIAQVLRRSRFKGAELALFGVVYTLVSPLALLAVKADWLNNLPDSELILALSAGILTYVTFGSLVPHARAIMHRRPKAIFGFVAAFAVSISLGFWHTALHHRLESESTSAGGLGNPVKGDEPSVKAP
jgi:zinc transporter ZupT